MRIHIAKGGVWTVHQEATFHFEYLDSPREQDLAREFADKQWPKIIDRSRSQLSGTRVEGTRRCRWKVKATGKKSKDMALLVQLLQEEMQLPDCTFSWNKETFELKGVKTSRGTRDSTGSIVGDIAVGLIIELTIRQVEAEMKKFLAELALKAFSLSIVDFVVGLDYTNDAFRLVWVTLQEMNSSQRVIITTDGKVSSDAPAIVDPNGKSLSIDANLLFEGEYPGLWIRIEDLQSR